MTKYSYLLKKEESGELSILLQLGLSTRTSVRWTKPPSQPSRSTRPSLGTYSIWNGSPMRIDNWTIDHFTIDNWTIDHWTID